MFTIVLLTLSPQIDLMASKPPVLIIQLDPFISMLIRPHPKDPQVVKLKKERAGARSMYFARTDAMNRTRGCWQADVYEYVEEQRALWANLAELAVLREEKLQCAEMRVAAAKQFEIFIILRVVVGSEPPRNINVVKAARIDAEIDLLKLKEGLSDK